MYRILPQECFQIMVKAAYKLVLYKITLYKEQRRSEVLKDFGAPFIMKGAFYGKEKCT